MINVGILTFHRAVNYGAVLQSYALTMACRNKCGVNCEIIDYHCPFIEQYYNSRFLLLPRNWKRLISYILFNGNIFPNKKRLESFLEDHNCLSNRAFFSEENLNAIVDTYSSIISGSDQVWSPLAAGFDRAYFLTFVEEKNKKRSYAASLGVSDLTEEQLNEYGIRLSGFHNYSVREPSAKDIIEKILPSTRVTVDVDPTLLLNRQEWLSSICDERIRNKIKKLDSYILVYCISENSSLFCLAKKLSLMLNKKVIYINDKWRPRVGVINISKCNIDEWLTLFLKASYVVTDSFHGTVFSVIFGKTFCTFQALNSKRSTRILSLLSALELEDRIINEKLVLFPSTEIDYFKVYTRLDRLRANSLNNLKSIVDE